jgi:hypothetical protein
MIHQFRCRRGVPDHIGQAAFVERIRSDTARYDQFIRQPGVRSCSDGEALPIIS